LIVCFFFSFYINISISIFFIFIIFHYINIKYIISYMSYYCITDASSIVLYAPGSPSTQIPNVNITNHNNSGTTIGQIQLGTSTSSSTNSSYNITIDGTGNINTLSLSVGYIGNLSLSNDILYYYLGNYGTTTAIPYPTTGYNPYPWYNFAMASNMIGGITETDFICLNPNSTSKATSGFAFWNNGCVDTADPSCNLLMVINELGPYSTAVGQLSVGNIYSTGSINAIYSSSTVLSLSSYNDSNGTYGYIQTQTSSNTSTSGLYLCLPNQSVSATSNIPFCNASALGYQQLYITSNLNTSGLGGQGEIDFVNLWSQSLADGYPCGFNFYNMSTSPQLLMSINKNTLYPTATGFLSVSELLTTGITSDNILNFNLGNRNNSSSFTIPPSVFLMSSNMTGGHAETDFVNTWQVYGKDYATGGFNFYNNGVTDGSCNLLMSINDPINNPPNSSAMGQLSVGSIYTPGNVNASGTVTGGNISTSGTVNASGTVTGGNLIANSSLTIGTTISSSITTFMFDTGITFVNGTVQDYFVYLYNHIDYGPNPAVLYSFYIPNGGTFASWPANQGGVFLYLNAYRLDGVDNYLDFGVILTRDATLNFPNGGTLKIFVHIISNATYNPVLPPP
jgi:hypothetical protein